MSIAQLDVGAYGSPDGPGDSRLPPQDVHAEQSVLGGMLLSKDAIGDVAEALKSTDFYRPAHELIYDAIVDLFSRGEPVDAITVADEMTKRGTLQRIGGQAYLHDLIQSVPTAANAGYYATIVSERAVLRRLVEAGTRIVQLGYGQGEGDVDDIVNRAQAEVYAVADKRGSEDYVALAQTLEETLNEIEVASGRSDEFTGVPTGFHELDELLHGLHKGQMIVVAARPAVGKALALDTALPTPTGWTTMGDVAVGDVVLGADGRATRVTNATEVMVGRSCFAVEFSDGSVLVADAEHQWLTDTRASRRSAQAARTGRQEAPGGPTYAAIRTTAEIADSLRVADGDGFAHTIPVTAPLDCAVAQRLPVPPYAVGVHLAQAAGLDCADDAVIADRASEGVDDAARGWLAERLDGFAVPGSYLRAGEAQRRAVLAGVLDACGEMAGDGEVVLTLRGAEVAASVVELVVSLGMQVRTSALVVAGGGSGELTEVKIDCDQDVFTLPRKAMLHKALRGRSVRARTERFVVAVRPVASVPVRCIEVDNADHLFLAGRSMIPTHNSTFGMDVARSAAIKHKMATAFFSLEMSRTEISMRVLAAEGTISLQDLRKGTIGDHGWEKLAQLVGKISDSPLYIDDSPNMSLMEIRAKCRRLKQQHNLKLVVIDYLQLMSSGKKVESRQQEVSEFSRALKLLAKEIEVPVIAISQLNRGPEQRTDKRPQMSDLRESGCLTADTRILRADTGAESTLGELYATGARDIEVWAMDEGLRAVRRTMTHVFSTGVAPVFRLTLASGKTVRATENHPLLTYDGWRPLAALRSGTRVAVPRHVLAPQQQEPMTEDHVIMLAHLLGDGSFVKRQPIRYASIDESNLAAVTKAALSGFGIVAVRDDYAVARCTTLRLPAPFRLARGRRNPIAEWLDELGLFGLRSHEKFVPARVASIPKDQIALFIRHLWATDGSVTVNKSGRGGRIYYASTSRRLIDDVARLLLRFGIQCRVRVTLKTGYRPGYSLDISGVDSQRRFLQEIGVHGARGAQASKLLDIVRNTRANTNVDTIPTRVWDDVRDVLVDQGLTTREFQAALGSAYCGSSFYKRAPSRERLARVATVLDCAELELMAVNDVFWDEVVSIVPDGIEEVFDATVPGAHNFVANGITVHNSIEQDADVVILLHKDKEREGEADVLVVKHRNGPTKDITLGFQGHYARFANMAASF